MIKDVDPRILAPLTAEQIRKWCWDGCDWRRLMQQASAHGSDAWWIAYGWYLQSRAWKKKSDKRRDIDGHKCTNCHNSQHLQAHHLSYKNVGDEDVQNDLITLCERCHKVRHAMPRPTAALLLEQVQNG